MTTRDPPDPPPRTRGSHRPDRRPRPDRLQRRQRRQGRRQGRHPRTPTASAPQSPTATPTPAGDLDGNWLTTNGGKAIVLVITGKQAGLFTTGGSVCNGEAESRTIHLKCANGAAGDRTTGRVDSVDKSSLKVTWEGDVGTETYTRSEGGKVPPRLPTAGLGS